MQKNTDIIPPHEFWMQRALELARRSVGLASPNPAVGCVIVKDGLRVGEGFHQYDLLDHAEIVALKQAGDAARGATAYVTLEPCCHTGRTGPCSRAFIEARVARVVIATGDPNPAVDGGGIAQLREAGIAVETGLLEQEARAINDGFARSIRTGLPFVQLKAAVSLDGRIAPAPGSVPPGSPFYITGEEARAEVQRMRHSVDAVITGINTVLQDNPRLTDRTELPRRRPLLRVVLDSALRIPLESQLVRSAREDLLVFCMNSHTERQQSLEAMGVRVERIGAAESVPGGAPQTRGVSITQVLRRLGEMKMLAVMLEGGSQLNTSALRGAHVDHLTLFYAPLFLGPAGVPLLEEPIPAPLFQREPSVARFGSDVRVQGYLRDPWA